MMFDFPQMGSWVIAGLIGFLFGVLGTYYGHHLERRRIQKEREYEEEQERKRKEEEEREALREKLLDGVNNPKKALGQATVFAKLEHYEAHDEHVMAPKSYKRTSSIYQKFVVVLFVVLIWGTIYTIFYNVPVPIGTPPRSTPAPTSTPALDITSTPTITVTSEITTTITITND